MRNLEQEQRAMRKRNRRASQKEVADQQPSGPTRVPDEQFSSKQLKARIAALEAENQQLRAENEKLRRQKTIVVGRPAAQSSADADLREQRHLFFKYSNARRY